MQECIEHLRQESKLHVPTDDDDWSAQLRTDIVVRRMHLIKDAVKEAKKTRFDPSKLICVSIMIVDISHFCSCSEFQCNKYFVGKICWGSWS